MERHRLNWTKEMPTKFNPKLTKYCTSATLAGRAYLDNNMLLVYLLYLFQTPYSGLSSGSNVKQM